MDNIIVTDVQREEFYRLFPRLRHTPHCFTSSESDVYNCVAWAVGDNTVWWDPAYEPNYFWPIDNHDSSLDSYIQMFRSQGFAGCSDPHLEMGIEKIAIYVKDDRFTHVARQLPSGEWTSKCGQTFDLTHTLDAFEGEEYGMVTIVMQRPYTRRQV